MDEDTNPDPTPVRFYYLVWVNFVVGFNTLSSNRTLLLRMWGVRHAQLDKGMKPEFEEHVRCLMATGSTARQARESLLLDAGHFLGTLAP